MAEKNPSSHRAAPAPGPAPLASADLESLMKALDPTAHPVIVMGPQDYLAR